MKVTEVFPRSAAEAAGVAIDDEVLAFGATTVREPQELVRAVGAGGIGRTFPVLVLRQGTERTLEVTLTERPDLTALRRQMVEGKPAADFDLQSVGPHVARLADLRGNVIVIEFFATWCGPCRRTLPVLEQLHQAHTHQGLRVFAISDEPLKDVQAFQEKLGLTFTVGTDPDHKAARGYGVSAFPTLIVIDRRGIVRLWEQGYTEGLEELRATVLESLREP